MSHKKCNNKNNKNDVTRQILIKDTIYGRDGLSAYEIAKKEGKIPFDWSESQFIDSLKGEAGEQGPQGIPGEPGPQGPKGDPLTWDDLTEAQKLSLKGEKGDKGDPGPKGEDGDSVYSLTEW